MVRAYQEKQWRSCMVSVSKGCMATWRIGNCDVDFLGDYQLAATNGGSLVLNKNLVLIHICEI